MLANVLVALDAAAHSKRQLNMEQEDLSLAVQNTAKLRPELKDSITIPGDQELVEKNIRLPRDVLPIRYDVRLFPVLEKGNFSILGRISIDVQCKIQTDCIVLHSVDIVVDPASVKVIVNNLPKLCYGIIQFFSQVTEQRGTDKELAIDGIDYDIEAEFLIIRLSPQNVGQLIEGTNYTLSMDFVGNLNDELRGLYRSTYKEDGIEK